MPYHSRRGEFLISTDPSLIDLDAVHEFLANSYWSPDIPRAVVARGIEHSICFGVYHAPNHSQPPAAQVGFARVISDWATFAYISDVFILEAWRGRDLSKWLMETILAHPDLQNLRRWTLFTRDAQGLYKQFGFKDYAGPPPTLMERKDPDVYKRTTVASGAPRPG